MMSMEMNQILGSHALFYDPIYKKIELTNLVNIEERQFEDITPGVIVEKDGRVLLTLFAPGAMIAEVIIYNGQFRHMRIPMDRKEDGYFSTRLSGLSKGFFYCDFIANGQRVLNPLMPLGYSSFRAMHCIDLPATEEGILVQGCPRGKVVLDFYPSSVTGRMKMCYVYLPPEDGSKEYPVCYLQHGVGESESSWVWQGKIPTMMENLLHDEECSPMIIVMNCGYALVPGEDPILYPGNFEQELMQDCIPYIERKYPVNSQRSKRAIAGHSLGAAQALEIYRHHSQSFGYLGLFSTIMLPDETIPQLELLFLSYGEKEPLSNEIRWYGKKHQEMGVRSVISSYDGECGWSVWRRSFRDFVRILFRGDDDAMYPQESDVSQSRMPELLKYDQFQQNLNMSRQNYQSSGLCYDAISRQLVMGFDDSGAPAAKYRMRREPVSETEDAYTFSLYLLPGASYVELVILGMQPVSLERLLVSKEEECWSVTISKALLAPGFHFYEYRVDDMYLLNLSGAIGFSLFRYRNYLDVPEPDYKAHQLRFDIPRGTLILERYDSHRIGTRERACYVYLPPGYQKDGGISYPTLYLQHGGGESEAAWIWYGKIHQMMDHWIAEGKCPPMIVVMNAGYSFCQRRGCHPRLGCIGDILVQECVPYIEEQYAVAASASKRYIAGLSMGAMQVQRTVFDYPGLFRRVGLFSGGISLNQEDRDYSSIMLSEIRFRELFDLYFVGIGRKDPFYQEWLQTRQLLQEQGVSLAIMEEEGYHNWTFWRHCLAEFVAKL